jgi:hypothetical protein
MNINTNYTKRTLSLVLAAIMVFSIVTPYALGVAQASSQPFDEDDDGVENEYDDERYVCGDESYKSQEDALLRDPGDCATQITDDQGSGDYQGAGEMYRFIEETNFFSEDGTQKLTPWAAVGDTSFRYVHVSETQYKTPGGQWIPHPIGSASTEQRTVDVWYKQIARYQDGQFSGIEEDKISDDYQKDFAIERGFGEYSDSLYKVNVLEGKAVGVIELDVDSGQIPASERAFAEAMFADMGTSLDEFLNSEPAVTSEEPSNKVDEFLKQSTEESSDTRGSVVDYSLDSNNSMSVYMGRFKDSQTADELFEVRSTPPRSGTSGDVSNFNKMTSESGQAEITANNGLNIGFTAYRVPDTSLDNGMTLVMEADKYPDDVNVQIVTRTGEVIQNEPMTSSLALNDEAMQYANENNALHVVVTSNSYSGNIAVSCMAAVTNTNTATSCSDGTTVSQTLQLGQSDADTIEDSREEFDVDSNETEYVPGSILDYNTDSVTFSESVTYTDGYVDGDAEQEYFEKNIPTTVEPKGDIEDYPSMMDSDSSTSATLSGDANGLAVVYGSDDVPVGQNHAVVIDYEIQSGDKPSILLTTMSGHKMKVGSSELTKGGSNTLVIDATSMTEYINRNGALFVTVQAASNTQMQISCSSFVASVEDPSNVTCDGSVEDGGATAEDVGSQVTDDNFNPTADFSSNKQAVSSGEPITLDASSTYDDDGNIQQYKWNVNGQTLTGEVVTVDIQELGTQQVSLTVTDDDGATDTSTRTVEVNQDFTTKYTYDVRVPDTKVQTGVNSPGPAWDRGEVVNTEQYTTVVDTLESSTDPGSNWEKSQTVRTETRVVDTETKYSDQDPGSSWTKTGDSRTRYNQVTEYEYREDTDKPGSDWEKVEKTGEQTRQNTDYKTVNGITPRLGGDWVKQYSYSCTTTSILGGSEITICDKHKFKKTTSYTVDVYKWEKSYQADEPYTQYEYEKDITSQVDVYEWKKTEQRVEKTYKWTTQGTTTESRTAYGSVPSTSDVVQQSVQQTTISCDQLSDTEQANIETCHA